MQPTTVPNLPADLRDLIKILNRLDAKYLIIGGVAYGYFAQPRYTKDLDLFVGTDPENASRVYRALAEFGIPLGAITPDDLISPGNFFRFGHEPAAVDILPRVPGISFEDSWERRLSGLIDGETQLHGNVISKEDLIASKLASGRPRDLGDVDDIRCAERAVKAKSNER
jgi:hypothetical protein